MTNALSIDLEDWPQSVLDPSLPITGCVVRNTERVLALLQRHRVRATFFALGKPCEAHPKLLASVAGEGHEIATHGWGHELLFNMTPQRFRVDLQRSIDVIQSQVGMRPIGYRAPAFSITNATRWAGPILAELGIRYSSSIFPIAGRRYGIPSAPRFPHRWPTCNLIEFPLTTIRRFGRNLPVAGGGYFRLLPKAILSGAIREVNREGQPAVVYLHPYEFASGELSTLQKRGLPLGLRTYLGQSLFRGLVPGRLHALLSEFPFAPLADVLRLNSAGVALPARTHEPTPSRHGLVLKAAG